MSQLSSLLDELENEYRREETELAAKQARVENLRQQIQLLRQLVALRDGEGDFRETRLDLFRAMPASTRSVSELVREVLAARGKPMHISDIREALIAQGHSIPGRGTDANIIAHIIRDESMARVARGTYALASWGLQAKPKKKRRAKPRAPKAPSGAR
jgi:hypothetical protein